MFLSNFPYLPDVICISETKVKNDMLTSITLPGFEAIEHAVSLTNAGGVDVYVAYKFSGKVLNKNDLNSECEDVRFQISEKNSREIFNLGVTYRYPNKVDKNFIVAFNDKLSKLNPKTANKLTASQRFRYSALITDFVTK